MDHVETEKFLPPFPVNCKCCGETFGASFDKPNPEHNFYCLYCTDAIAQFEERFLRGFRFNHSGFWPKNPNKDKGRKNYVAVFSLTTQDRTLYDYFIIKNQIINKPRNIT